MIRVIVSSKTTGKKIGSIEIYSPPIVHDDGTERVPWTSATGPIRQPVVDGNIPDDVVKAIQERVRQGAGIGESGDYAWQAE